MLIIKQPVQLDGENVDHGYGLTTDEYEVHVVNLVEYKPIIESERYVVSFDGEIYDLVTKRKRSFNKNTKTYCGLSLWIGDKRTYRHVHRLVAQAWIDNPNNLPIVNHIDRNIRNFSADNLEWLTQKQNIEHSVNIIGDWRGGYTKGYTGNKSKLSKPLKAVCNQTGQSLFYYGVNDAERYSNGLFNRTDVSKACRGLIDNYKGYTWCYLSKEEFELVDKSLFEC